MEQDVGNRYRESRGSIGRETQREIVKSMKVLRKGHTNEDRQTT